jgi:hypothetical protein
MPVEILPYVPERLWDCPGLPGVPTSWDGLEKIIPDIIRRFNIETYAAIEFGVWHGYSTAALANNFEHVIGVDTFVGDILVGTSESMIETTRKTLSRWPNIRLVESAYQDFHFDVLRPGLIHIDILHTYEHTFACGVLALNQCDCVIFHDTESFVEVKRAVSDLAGVFNRKFYNYPHCHGLGILAKEPKC